MRSLYFCQKLEKDMRLFTHLLCIGCLACGTLQAQERASERSEAIPSTRSEAGKLLVAPGLPDESFLLDVLTQPDAVSPRAIPTCPNLSSSLPSAAPVGSSRRNVGRHAQMVPLDDLGMIYIEQNCQT